MYLYFENFVPFGQYINFCIIASLQEQSLYNLTHGISLLTG